MTAPMTYRETIWKHFVCPENVEPCVGCKGKGTLRYGDGRPGVMIFEICPYCGGDGRRKPMITIQKESTT